MSGTILKTIPNFSFLHLSIFIFAFILVFYFFNNLFISFLLVNPNSTNASEINSVAKEGYFINSSFINSKYFACADLVSIIRSVDSELF